MISLLAQTLPDANSSASLGWVLAVLFALAGGALVIKQLFARTPALHEEFVTRKEFDAFAVSVSAQLLRMEEKSEQRVVRIYDKIEQSAERQTARLIELMRKEKEGAR